MNDERVEDWIRHRAKMSAQTPEPTIDVADRVMATIHSQPAINIAIDRTPLILGGGLVTIAATVMVALLPSAMTMTEPWISFWLF